ncbi:YIP1 family protein [Persephonella hydrogeniphila]|uniref:YIP1 family protein n=1 Tax=Persephonella hydrogeniphila TaxID=198703 RepID=UPI000BE28EE7|nr:DUF1282 domain-containing protein [Persephonella hydrogeniphila]
MLKVLIKPDYWKYIFKDGKTGWHYLAKYGLSFALIGPILSFFSLTSQSNYSMQKALLYSTTTYFMDILMIIIFSYTISKILKKDLNQILKFYTVVNIPIWISDVVDIYQPLRILSNVGLIYSFYVLWTGSGFVTIKKYYFFIAIFHILLYIINAFLSELIATNPILKALLM